MIKFDQFKSTTIADLRCEYFCILLCLCMKVGIYYFFLHEWPVHLWRVLDSTQTVMVCRWLMVGNNVPVKQGGGLTFPKLVIPRLWLWQVSIHTSVVCVCARYIPLTFIFWSLLLHVVVFCMQPGLVDCRIHWEQFFFIWLHIQLKQNMNIAYEYIVQLF